MQMTSHIFLGLLGTLLVSNLVAARETRFSSTIHMHSPPPLPPQPARNRHEHQYPPPPALGTVATPKASESPIQAPVVGGTPQNSIESGVPPALTPVGATLKAPETPARAPAVAGRPSRSPHAGVPPAITPAGSGQAPTPTSPISAETGNVSGSEPEEGNADTLGASAVEFNVLDYGALGDGKANDSQAFADAWTAACAVASGYVHAPAGYKFKLYPVSFKGPCLANLIFKVDGTILAPADPSVWATNGKLWLAFKKVSMTMQGSGTINGQGQQWWANSCKTNAANPCVDAPTALVFDTCTNVTVKNVAILDSQQMHLAFEKSSGILVNNVVITAPGTSPNTDGIHLQNSSNVNIQNTIIATGDDCVSIQTGSFNVRIYNVTCGPGHGISIGGLGKSKSTAQLANLVVDTVVFNGATNGVRIKTWQGSSGYAKDFTFKNIKMVNTKNPVLIDQYYCDSASSGSCANYTSNVVISDMSYQNIKGTSATQAAVRILCSETVPCQGINLDDINLVQTSGKAATSVCDDAWGSASNTIIPESCLKT